MKKNLKILFIILFIIYVFLAIYFSFSTFLLLKSVDFNSIELIPFLWIHSIIFCTENGFPIEISETINYLFRNFIFLFPAGFLIPLIWGKIKNYKTAILYGFLFSLIKEFLQLFFTFSDFIIDDIILNILGFLLGFYIYKIYSKKIKKCRMFFYFTLLFRGQFNYLHFFS